MKTRKKLPETAEISEHDLPPVLEVTPEGLEVLRQPDYYLNLHQRFNEVRKEVTYIKKEKKTGMQYAVVSHDEVTAKLRPSLVRWGILFYPQHLTSDQDGNRTRAWFDLRFVNEDEPRDYIDVPTFGYGVDPSDKGPGKAVSYGVKMALLKAFNLETGTGEDPDFDQESVYKPEPPKEPGMTATVAKALAMIEPVAKDTGTVELLSVAVQAALKIIETPEDLTALMQKVKYIFEMEEYSAAKGQAVEAFKQRKSQISAEGII